MKQVFIAKHEHKHGTLSVAFATHDGAQKQLREWARTQFEDWGSCCADPECPAAKEENAMNDRELVSHWPMLTGHTEFLFVEEVDFYNW